jgi:hypothetical protein
MREKIRKAKEGRKKRPTLPLTDAGRPLTCCNRRPLLYRAINSPARRTRSRSSAIQPHRQCVQAQSRPRSGDHARL